MAEWIDDTPELAPPASDMSRMTLRCGAEIRLHWFPEATVLALDVARNGCLPALQMFSFEQAKRRAVRELAAQLRVILAELDAMEASDV